MNVLSDCQIEVEKALEEKKAAKKKAAATKTA